MTTRWRAKPYPNLSPGPNANPNPNSNQVAIAQAGGIPLLVALTRDGTEDQQTAAAVALANLAHNADNQVSIAQVPGGIKHLVALVRDGTGAQRTFADHALKQLALDADNQVP